MKMLFLWMTSLFLILTMATSTSPYRIVLDTDVDTDDFFAILYLLKLNPSEFDLQ
ncbi:putative ribonucleoside hydrolase, partial [Tanacetum coccineum]